MLIDSAIGIYMLWGIVKFIWSVISKLVYWVILFGVIIGGIWVGLYFINHYDKMVFVQKAMEGVNSVINTTLGKGGL